MPALSSLCGGLALTVGLLVLSGWMADIRLFKSILPGFPAAQPFTAMAMGLCGAALMLQAGRAAVVRQAALALAFLVVLMCLLTFLAYAGIDVGMDRWLFSDRLAEQPSAYEFPGRMSRVTAACFLLVALAIGAKSLRRFETAATAGATLTFILAGATLVAYLFKTGPLYGVVGFNAVALPTAIALAALSGGLLMAEPVAGWPRRLTLDTAGGQAARALLPWAIGLPIAASGVALVGSRAGLYTPDFRLAAVATASAVLLGTAVMLAAKRIDIAEAERDADRTARAQAEERLLQAQKMAAMGQMASSVAHDFNNLLLGLQGALKALADPGTDADRLARYREAGEQSLVRATDLTRSLLAFARQEPVEKQTFEVTARIRAMERVLSTTLGSRMMLELEMPNIPAWIEVEPTRFDVALLNLVVNARDASGRRGQVTICVESVESPESHLWVAVRVRDRGSGISAEVLPHIFQPFYTTKAAGTGTGLGLAQVHAFAEESGGELAVESEPGHGSTFTILLPPVEKPASVPPDRARRKQDPMRHRMPA